MRGSKADLADMLSSLVRSDLMNATINSAATISVHEWVTRGSEQQCSKLEIPFSAELKVKADL